MFSERITLLKRVSAVRIGPGAPEISQVRGNKNLWPVFVNPKEEALWNKCGT